MKRWLSCVFLAVAVLGTSLPAWAETRVKMRGDVFIMGDFHINHNYTGWTKTGAKTEDNFEIWQRYRLRADFEANKSVYFRLGLRIIDVWGAGTYTAANPAAAILVDVAYLQFRVPDTSIQVIAGYQPVELPQNTIFNGSVIYSDLMAALAVQAPLVPDTLSLIAGFGRLFDANRTYDTSTTQVSDEFDAYFLALPVTLEGFKATPWGAFALAGRDAIYTYKNTADVAEIGNSFDNALFSAASIANMAQPTGLGHWKNSQNPYFWVGGAFEVSALDPLRFYADVVYGEGAMQDTKAAKRHGWMVDFAAQYTGLTFMTPQVFAFWSTGEDGSTRNGSERMPYLRSSWGPGKSFLFECGQDLPRDTSTYTTPVGIYGFGASLDNINFMEKLSNRLTFVYVHGNNSPRAIRAAQLLNTSYMTMGHDLSENEHLFGLNLDTKYNLYDCLDLVTLMGWAHGQFQESVWGHRLASQAASKGDNSWLLAVGLIYKF